MQTRALADTTPPNRSVVVGTAGHIDHGKSALVRALTGVDPDRLKEERERGITIDLGFAHLEAAGTNLAFVDVPGHERFIKNMLAGAGGIDLVLLVVAADESVMPQTREHFEICRLLGVPAGIVVLTKVDIADAEMQEIAIAEIREMIAGSFLAAAPIVRVSSRTGLGLDELVRALTVASAAIPERSSERPARLPVDRVFTVKGFGTVVTGTLVAGALDATADLVALPSGLTVKARGLQVHGSGRGHAGAGQRVAVNLSGVEVADLSRGATLCTPGSLEVTRRVDVSLELLADAQPLAHGARVRFHQGTSEVFGRVAIAALLGDGRPAAEIPGAGQAYARIRLETAAALTRGDRFIIRSYSPCLTVGGGVVLDPQPPRGALRTASGLRRFRQLDAALGDETAIVLALALGRGAAGLTRASLVSRLGHSTTTAAQAIGVLESRGEIASISGSLVATGALRELATALLAAIDKHHLDHPLSDGLPREEARERIFSAAAPGVFEHVLERLAADRLVLARERLARAGHHVALTIDETAALEALDALFRAVRLGPPDLATAARDAGIELALADRMTKLLLRRHRLVVLDGLMFHSEALTVLKQEVRDLKGEGVTRVDVRSFKDRYGVSRKYAIPLLEYLDRERVTRRSGDSRVIL